MREKEIAIRAALGAGRKRILVQLFTESMLLALLGGAFGVLLAFAGLRVLKTIFPAGTPRIEGVVIDGHVLGFALVVAVVVGMVFGLVPAFHASRPALDQVLRSNPRGSGLSKKRTRLSGALVITEISLATLLVSAAGLLVKTLWVISQLNPGFEYKHLVVARVTPSVSFCREVGRCPAFYNMLLEQLSSTLASRT